MESRNGSHPTYRTQSIYALEHQAEINILEMHFWVQDGAVVLSVEKFILMLNSEKCYQQSKFVMILNYY